LLNNRIWPHSSEVGAVCKRLQKQYLKNIKNERWKGKIIEDRIIGLRLSPKEYEQIEKQFSNSTARKMSDYVRHVLFDKPITVYQRNKSLDDFMAEMILLRNELNRIGNKLQSGCKKTPNATANSQV
jgi:hypothetical protein